jgi:hypothetical protein
MQPLTFFFKLAQPLTVSRVQCTVLCTLKETGGKPDRKPYPLSYGLRNPYRNLKAEKSHDYAQKPQQNCAFMNSASGQGSYHFSAGLTLRQALGVLYEFCNL